MILISSETLLMDPEHDFQRSSGFATKPSDPLDVPYHNEERDSTLAAAGVLESHIRKESSDGFPWTSRAIVSLKRGAKKRNIRYQSFTHLWEIEQLTKINIRYLMCPLRISVLFFVSRKGFISYRFGVIDVL
jgi:hypothetical protein